MIDTIESIGRLETLAAWHRLSEEDAGSAWVWNVRLRTAEDLERRAAELRARRVHTIAQWACGTRSRAPADSFSRAS